MKTSPNLNGWQWQRSSTCEVSPLELRCRRLRRGHASFMCDVCGSQAAVSSTPWTYKSRAGTTAPAGLLFLAQPLVKTTFFCEHMQFFCILTPFKWRFLHPSEQTARPNLTASFLCCCFLVMAVAQAWGWALGSLMCVLRGRVMPPNISLPPSGAAGTHPSALSQAVLSSSCITSPSGLSYLILLFQHFGSSFFRFLLFSLCLFLLFSVVSSHLCL